MQQIKAMKRKIGDPWGSGLYMTPLEQKFWEGGGGGVLSEEPSVGGGVGYLLESHNKQTSLVSFY